MASGAELPAMASTQYASQAFNMAAFNPIVQASQQLNQASASYAGARRVKLDPRDERLAKLVAGIKPENIPDLEAEAEEEHAMARRVVQVFIADPDPKLALEDSLVYKGEQHFTDMDDQELFFQLDIRTLLATHNEKRVKTVDKTVKEREQTLEPARIRDLKMTVVTVASF